MLTNTFSHIPGIGLITEKRLWESSIRSWDDFVEPYPNTLSSGKIALIKNYIDLSQKHLARQPEYFAGLLAPDNRQDQKGMGTPLFHSLAGRTQGSPVDSRSL